MSGVERMTCMNLETWYTSIVTVGKRLYDSKLTHGTNGNISCRIHDDCILITGAGTNLDRLRREDIIKLDINGKGSTDKRPSSETPMHLAIYQRNPDITAIIHAHPPFSTAFAVAGISLEEPILPEVTNPVGQVPVIPYQKPHSQALADSISEAVERGNKYMFMANHGFLGAGDDLLRVCNNIQNIEFLCEVVIYAKILGNVNALKQN